MSDLTIKESLISALRDRKLDVSNDDKPSGVRRYGVAAATCAASVNDIADCVQKTAEAQNTSTIYGLSWEDKPKTETDPLSAHISFYLKSSPTQ